MMLLERVTLQGKEAAAYLEVMRALSEIAAGKKKPPEDISPEGLALPSS